MRRALSGMHYARRLLGLAPVQGLLKRDSARVHPVPATSSAQGQESAVGRGGGRGRPAPRQPFTHARWLHPDGAHRRGDREKVLAGQPTPGFQTPSLAYGPDLIMEIEGVERED